MNVLVLAAGNDDAFKDAGFPYPKNLVEIDGLPLVERVIERLSGLIRDERNRFIFCIRKEENRRHHTGAVIRLLIPQATVLEVSEQTGGAACTALLAIEAINDGEPLLILNGDQILLADLTLVVRDFRERGLDGGIVVFEAVHPRWSYVKIDERDLVIETAEKRPISNLATAGTYFFSRGADFVHSAMSMIEKDAQVNGSFYICPSYNEMILLHRRIGIFRVSREAYLSLATPQGVRLYEDYLRSEAGTYAAR